MRDDVSQSSRIHQLILKGMDQCNHHIIVLVEVRCHLRKFLLQLVRDYAHDQIARRRTFRPGKGLYNIFKQLKLAMLAVLPFPAGLISTMLRKWYCLKNRLL